MVDLSKSASEAAPAKVNLTLHVTGQRGDGYHLLDSFVVFVDIADRVTVRPAHATSLCVVGPRSAGVPTDRSNLVWKAAELMGGHAKITLEKHLPAAAGLGGGSSDAAACLRGMATLAGTNIPPLTELTMLGADVPVCMTPRPQRMSGVGDRLEPVANVPPCALVLVNPGVDVPTPSVFQALVQKVNPPMPKVLPTWVDATEFFEWLRDKRNDLQAPACAQEPVIVDVLSELETQSGVALARMSGSGATCFGMCSDLETAEAVAQSLGAAHPNWWVAAGQVLRG